MLVCIDCCGGCMNRENCRLMRLPRSYGYCEECLTETVVVDCSEYRKKPAEKEGRAP